jgi:tRNA dimethylallyltransferase
VLQNSSNKYLIIIAGPTAVGKTSLSIQLAKKLNCDIISADSRQIYKEISIGTAKPDWKNEKIPHHLFDVLDEPRDYTVVEYKKALLTICEEIWARGAIPVVVGGSGFYIKSLFSRIFSFSIFSLILFNSNPQSAHADFANLTPC